MRPHLLRLLAVTTASAALVACRGEDPGPAGANGAATTGGTVVIAVPTDVDILLPPLVVSLEGKKASDMLFDHLAEIGPKLNTVGDEGFEPQLAERWTWAADSMSIAFHLNPKARWHDGRPVRAEDVKFTHATYAAPETGSPHAQSVADIDSVSVRDSLTAVVWFKRRSPEQFFTAVYHMHILPAHLLAGVPRTELKSSPFARQPVGSGRFRFARWVPGERLELVADTAHYRGRAKLDRVVWSVAPDFTAASSKLFAGEADFFEVMRPEMMPQLARNASLKAVPYPALQIGFLLFNERDPKANARPNVMFADRNVRRALTMSLDRKLMLRTVLDSLGYVGLGPFTRTQASADETIPQLPFDLARARATLDSAGWRDANGDGVREKGGRPLEFTIMVPSSSKNRVRYAVLIQDQLKQVGARVHIEEMDFNAFNEHLRRRDFDAVVDGRALDPSPGVVRESWTRAAVRAKDGANYGSYESAAFDAALDSAVVAAEPARSRAHFRRAYETINEDAPAVWLYELRQVAGAHKRLNITGVRADAWWAGIADWTIPADQRIERDRLGLPKAARTTEAAGAVSVAGVGRP